MNSTEILLINLTLHCNSEAEATYAAPLGLYCLAGIYENKVEVVDKKANIYDETICLLNPNIKTVICLLPEKTNVKTLEEFCLELKKANPNLKIGLSKPIENYKNYADFVDEGNGRNTICRILRGETMNGTIKASAEELAPIPFAFSSKFQDNGYEIAPEKMLTAKTIEIHRPWLGLQERNYLIDSMPDSVWIKNLFEALGKNGFTSFHFMPANFTPSLTNNLSIQIKNLNLRFSVSLFPNDEIELYEPSSSFNRIWYYRPENENALFSKIQTLHSKGFEVCLVINEKFTSPTPEALNLVERLVIENENAWNKQDLKNVISSYWWKNGRFVKRLFSLRHAAELVAFTKTSYRMLDMLVGKD